MGVATAEPVRALSSAPPVVIEARGLSKTFRIPTHKVDSLRERLSSPLTRQEHRELQALRDVSFDVRKGEFFAIVGRNGSGKSTLLKIMASIYRPDTGRVRMAGRLAPFIELGVGFNPELTSRENVVLNGVLMGLSRQEASRRLDAVLDFAELREFADLKLKNYSSGMMVRLAFSIMVEADADIMLIDEVLAVGDAAFGQKCMDVFREKRAAGKTLVLVTHDMATVQGFCDRAMLIHDAHVQHIGDPEETALRYYRLNFGGPAGPAHAPKGGATPDVNVKLLEAWLEDESGARADNIENGRPLTINAVVEARQDLDGPVFSFSVLDTQGVEVFGFHGGLDDDLERVPAGHRVRIRARVENRLLPGRYILKSWIMRNRTQGDLALHVLEVLDFYVFGTRMGAGRVWVETDMSAQLTDGPGA